jgi:hypothetical protein
MFSSLHAYAEVAGGMIAIDRDMPALIQGYDQMDFYLQVNDDGGTDSAYYWAEQFPFSNVSGSGYLGLQNRGNNEHYINFSIWNAEGYKDDEREGYCRAFGHEGTGIQCDLRYSWKEGVTYQFSVKKTILPANKIGWRLMVTDLGSFDEKYIGTIVTSSQWGGIGSNLTSFVEEFSQGANQLDSCNVIGNSAAVFHAPIGNSTVRPLSTTSRTYGNCQDDQINHVACDANQKCVTSISNNQANSGEFLLVSRVAGFCADTIGGNNDSGAVIGLWYCDTFNNNQRWIFHKDTSSIRLASKATMCLGLAGINAELQTCNGSNEQSWAIGPKKGSLLNNSMYCLDAAEGGILGSRMQGHNCLNNNYQQWERRPIIGTGPYR